MLCTTGIKHFYLYCNIRQVILSHVERHIQSCISITLHYQIPRCSGSKVPCTSSTYLIFAVTRRMQCWRPSTRTAEAGEKMRTQSLILTTAYSSGRNTRADLIFHVLSCPEQQHKRWSSHHAVRLGRQQHTCSVAAKVD